MTSPNMNQSPGFNYKAFEGAVGKLSKEYADHLRYAKSGPQDKSSADKTKDTRRSSVGGISQEDWERMYGGGDD